MRVIIWLTAVTAALPRAAFRCARFGMAGGGADMKWGRLFLFGPVVLAALVGLVLICLAMELRDACYRCANEFHGELDWRKVAMALAGVVVQAGLLVLVAGAICI